MGLDYFQSLGYGFVVPEDLLDITVNQLAKRFPNELKGVEDVYELPMLEDLGFDLLDFSPHNDSLFIAAKSTLKNIDPQEFEGVIHIDQNVISQDEKEQLLEFGLLSNVMIL